MNKIRWANVILLHLVAISFTVMFTLTSIALGIHVSNLIDKKVEGEPIESGVVTVPGLEQCIKYKIKIDCTNNSKTGWDSWYQYSPEHIWHKRYE